ncbi:cytochrome P450 [Auricularia subglabra TFB-10046 SS5]|nr:cytochrome P450 [Auricularia subglabra TFB-10046 SS5]
MTSDYSTVSYAVAALAAAALARHVYARARELPPPPGPPCRPILGISLKLLPRLEPWKTYAQWAKRYGPVFSFHVLGRRIIVLNSFEAVYALLNKRALIYSDRPLKYMYDVLMGRGTSVFNIPATDERHRVYRRLLHGSLNPRVVPVYRPIQQDEAIAFLQRLLDAPENFAHHIKRNAAAVIMRISYGYTIQEKDPFIDMIEESFRISSLGATQGMWMVDQFPILRFVPSRFPGAGFKRKAAEWRKQLDHMSAAPLEWTKQRMAAGTAAESFTSTHLQDQTANELYIQKCATALYAGGADTVVGAMSTFFLVMALNPDVQKRAQEEVDRVTGRTRLPNCTDLDALPSVKRIMQEILRWAPVAPVALPHCLTQDDEYMGFRMQKGATVYANLWAIFHDPKVYENPDSFNPERFNPETHLPLPPDPLDWAFGFGKRICPGLHFAQVSLQLNMASVLSVFDILKPLDDAGREVSPTPGFTTGITSHPKPFACRIVPRSESSTKLIGGGI